MGIKHTVQIKYKESTEDKNKMVIFVEIVN